MRAQVAITTVLAEVAHRALVWQARGRVVMFKEPCVVAGLEVWLVR